MERDSPRHLLAGQGSLMTHSLNRQELGKECGALPPLFPSDHGHRGDLGATHWVARTGRERVLFPPEKAGAGASSEPKSRGLSTPRDATFRGGFRPETHLNVFNLAPPPGGATRRRHVSLRRPRVGEAKRGVGRHVSLQRPRVGEAKRGVRRHVLALVTEVTKGRRREAWRRVSPACQQMARASSTPRFLVVSG